MPLVFKGGSLDKIAVALRSSAVDVYLESANASLAAASTAYRDQFLAGIDPYGKPFHPGRSQPGPLHVGTGELSNPQFVIRGASIVGRAPKHGWIHDAGWVRSGDFRMHREIFPYRGGSWWWPQITNRINIRVSALLERLAASTGGEYTKRQLAGMLDVEPEWQR